MKTFLISVFLLPALAFGSPIPPEWNPEGFNLYRLFRISKTADLVDIRADFDRLISNTHQDQGLDAEQARARLAVMNGGRQILGDELYNRLYNTFGDALDNRYLKAAADLTLPNIDPLFIEYASKAANPLAEGKGAGLVHYAYFHEFHQLQLANPEVQATSFEELARAFNQYLTKKGVTGFQFQLERALSSKPKTGFFSEFWGHVPMMRVAAAGAAISCAMIIGSATTYYMTKPPPSARTEQVQNERVDPQVQADQDAQALGRETAHELVNPAP